MANLLKRTIKQDVGVDDEVYKVPVGATATIVGCRATNKTGVATYVTFKLNGAFVSGKVFLPANTSIDIMVGSKIVCMSEDSITCSSDAANSVDAVISYLEQS